MGSACSPEVANLTLLYKELQSKNYSIMPFVLKRYLDDIFVIIHQDQPFPTIYHNYLNIIWTNSSSTIVEFMDLKISIQGNRFLKFEVHQKLQNAYLYPHYDSNLPLSIKKGFIKGELIRYIRICSSKENFDWMKSIFTTRLIQRGYPLNLINSIMSKIPFFLKKTWNIIKNEDKPIPLHLSTLFDKRLFKNNPLKPILMKHWSLLSDDCFKSITPMVTWRIQRKFHIWMMNLIMMIYIKMIVMIILTLNHYQN